MLKSFSKENFAGLCRFGVVWSGLFPVPGNVKSLRLANSLDLARMLSEPRSPLLAAKRHDELKGKEGVVPVFIKEGQNAAFSFLLSVFSLFLLFHLFPVL